eukprot:CAMPEP_0113847992 /NCGR_PEP_ID=MMETSP0372-20130328/2200_1 /TAXON_ID=340204 /ORGANISM="Lankesteria abbotti" /LENGTH=301 /DNA_ID=CAMNT_0000817367 /DNA_START=388 /DNA_END=1293 /DNA_ORIENTATION=- /assembly_acc=CAM_ASM_000359
MRRCALQYNHETRRASRLPVLLLLLCCVIASVKGDINEEARFLKSVVTTGCWDDLTNCNIFVDIFQNICSSPSCRPLIVPFSFNDIGWIFKFSDAADDKLNPKKQNDVKKHDISKHHLSKRKVSKRVVTIYIGKDKRTTVIDFDGSATSSIYDIADILDFVTKLNKLSFLVKTLDVQGANDNNVELLGREFVDEMVDDLPDSCSTDLPACDIFTEKLSSFTAKNRLTPLVNVPSDVITTSSKYSFRRLSSHNGSSVNVLAFKQVYDGGFLLHQRNFGTTNETDLSVAYKVTYRSFSRIQGN